MDKFELISEASTNAKLLAEAGSTLDKELDQLMEGMDAPSSFLNYIPEDKREEVIAEGTAVSDFVEKMKAKIGSSDVSSNPRSVQQHANILAALTRFIKAGDNRGANELIQLYQTRGDMAAAKKADEIVSAMRRTTKDPKALEAQLDAFKSVVRGKAAGSLTPDKMKAFLDKYATHAKSAMGGSVAK